MDRIWTIPGTVLQGSREDAANIEQRFGAMFLGGGMVLSQVTAVTGLESHTVQNWVKRGFLTSPVKRVYSKEQFARIVIINMLRESLQIDRICGLIHIIGGVLEDTTDDLISDDELYHIYVDMLADESINVGDEQSVIEAAERAVANFESTIPEAKKKLVKILQVMLYAHEAAKLRAAAGDILSVLE